MSERTKTAKPKPKNDVKSDAKKIKPRAARPMAPVVRPRGMSARAR